MTQRPVKGARRVTRLALLTAIALTIFMVEAQIPVAVPIPGIKLGLANIVTVYTVFALGAGDALLVEDPEDAAFAAELLRHTWAALPAPRRKKPTQKN